MVILEAMASGVPVMNSKKVGAAELLRESPLITDMPDPKEFVMKIQKVLYETKLREKAISIGKKGK